MLIDPAVICAVQARCKIGSDLTQLVCDCEL
jgi:hypothetical protein